MYSFKKKGCEEQFSFNDKVDDQVQAAKKQLDKITAGDDSSRRTLEQAKKELEKGEEEIRFRQKLIRIADHSDWGVVAECIADELADDSDDEKRLFRARKERDAKRRCTASAGSARKKPKLEGTARSDDGGARRRPAGPPKPRQIGRCNVCSQWGHLARACPRNQQPYPFCQLASGTMCVSDSKPKKSVALNAVDAIHQGQGNVAKVDDKGQGLAPSNVKGQVEGVDGTVQ